MRDDEDKYKKALSLQAFNKKCGIVFVERLPNCYRLTKKSGEKVTVSITFGKKHFPIALCAKD